MGAIMRNAERLGLHRDGTVLQLSPYETEKRRRLWWQLQHLDIALAVRAGSISLTLSARWDTKLPLNIEDEDINPEMTTPPQERPGLTSISYCLWTFWVLQKQRAFRHADGRYLGFGWVTERSISREEKNGYIDRLEAGLNKQYVQYCDPIKPLDVLIQITARAFVCGMRRVSMYGDLSQMTEQARRKLLDVCMQGVEYEIALHATPAIKQFRPLFRGYFQWNALAYVLLEARRLPHDPITARIWELLADVYTPNPGLSQNLVDRRKSYAIELTSVAWKARASFLHQQQHEQGTTRSEKKPAFLVGLEKTLDEFNETTKGESSSKRKLEDSGESDASATKRHAVMPNDGLPSEGMDFNQLDLVLMNDFNFDAIDWSFCETAQ